MRTVSAGYIMPVPVSPEYKTSQADCFVAILVYRIDVQAGDFTLTTAISMHGFGSCIYSNVIE